LKFLEFNFVTDMQVADFFMALHHAEGWRAFGNKKAAPAQAEAAFLT